MIEVFVGCLVPLLLTTDNISEYKDCLNTVSKVEYVIEHTELVQRYFKEEDILRSLGVIYCESSGKAAAVGTNTNGTQDVGLWQFNDDTWAWLKDKLGIVNDRFNKETSTAIASWLVYNDGWHHWNSSNHCWKGSDNDMLWLRIRK